VAFFFGPRYMNDSRPTLTLMKMYVISYVKIQVWNPALCSHLPLRISVWYC